MKNFLKRNNPEQVARDDQKLLKSCIAEKLVQDCTSPGIINVSGDEKENGITKNIKVFLHDTISEQDKSVIYPVIKYQLKVVHVPIDTIKYLLDSKELANMIVAFKGLSLFQDETKSYIRIFVFPKSLEKQYGIPKKK